MIRNLLKNKYTKNYRLAVTHTVLNKIFDLAPPFLIGIAVDIVIKKEESLISQLGYKDPWDQLLIIAALTVIVWVLESIFEYLMECGWRNLAQLVQHDLRAKAFEHTINLDMRKIENYSSGELMSILNDDINQLERFLNAGAAQFIKLFITIIVIGGAFFYLAPQVAIWGVLPIPFIILGSFKFQKFLAPKYKNVRDKVGLLNSEFSNSISGVQTVKSFACESSEVRKITEYSKEYMTVNESAIKISSLFTPLIRMLILLGFLVNLLYGGYLCLRGDIAVGTYSVLIFMIQRLLWPLTSLGELLDLYQRSKASFKRIQNILKLENNIISGKQTLSKDNHNIEIKNVSFAYTEGSFVFEDLSLTVGHHKTVGLVGGTGSGKSTLIKLLLRFYDTNSGEILIGNKDIKDLDLYSLRRNIGYVGQDVYLFHGTILENISYGLENASMSEVVAAATKAKVHNFIETLPEGYNTIVGERGYKLSGGQRQRVSIARAIIKRPSILILDEATSAVDNETEAAIQSSLDEVKKGRTTIIIAHRLSTIVNADEIFVLKQGRIVQNGKHTELIQKNGPYKDLWAVQTGQ